MKLPDVPVPAISLRKLFVTMGTFDVSLFFFMNRFDVLLQLLSCCKRFFARVTILRSPVYMFKLYMPGEVRFVSANLVTNVALDLSCFKVNPINVTFECTLPVKHLVANVAREVLPCIMSLLHVIGQIPLV